MNQQQQIQSAITILNKSSASPAKTFKALSILVKQLDKYSNEDNVVTSERFIPCCLFTLPNKICEIIKHDPSTLLQEKPQKMGHRLLLNLYLKGMLKLLQSSDTEIKHIVVEGMSRAMVLLGPFPQLAKRWMKVLLDLWSTSSQNLQISLRCHIALSKFMQKCPSSSYMWALRRMYVCYFQNCKQVSWRNMEHINFMINSFCQVAKFDSEKAYYVMFGYLRSICLELDKLHKSKRKQKVELTNKLFSNQILNCLKLFTAVVTRIQAEQLTALIYPLCEILATYERITQAAEYIPLKLHLLEYQLTITETLGVFIPHTFQMIEKLIKSPVFTKKISKKSQKSEANIELAYKLSKGDLGQALLVNQLFKSLTTKIFWFQSLMCRQVYGPELIMKLHKIIKSHKYIFSEYQQQSQKSAALLKQDSTLIYEMRADAKMSILSQKKIRKFETSLKSTTFSGVQKYLKLKQQQEELLKNKLAAEQQNNKQEEQESGQDIKQQQDEVNSGWQQASQGASQMDPHEVSESEGSDEQGEVDEEQIQNIGDLQGDPEDADEAAKQWSQQQWSSQNEIQN